MQKLTQELSTGWVMKEHGGSTISSWLPVKKVPSQVHIDLLANKKSVLFPQSRTRLLLKHQ